MFVQAFLLLLTILIPGYYLRKEFSPFSKEKVFILYIFIESMTIGTATLILPMILVGVLIRDSLDQVVYFFFFLNGLVIIVYLVQSLSKIKDIENTWNTTNFKETIKKLELIRESTHVYDIKRVLVYIIATIITAITVFNFIMPTRGWDTLHFYLPNAKYFYTSDEIPAAPNFLNFLPAFKPPLNTLLLTYDLYLTTDFDAQLFPITYIIGILSLIYLFGKEIGFGDKFSLLVILHLITLPAFYMTFREYMYYQELPLTFFYSGTIFFFYKGRNLLKEGLQVKARYYFVIGSIAAALAVASKISGFTIFLAVLLLFPIFGMRKFNLIIKIPVVLGFTTFLVIKGIATNYVGTVVFVALLGLLLLYLLISDKEFQDTGLLKYMWTLAIPLIVSVVWLWQISRVDRASDFLYNLYFKIISLKINWSYEGVSYIELVYMENAQKSSWFMSIFAIFFGSQFNGLLGIFRLVSISNILRNRKESKLSFMLVWFTFFYMMWLTYFSTVSVRYLSIVWIPISFMTVDGMLRTYDFFIRSSERKFYMVIMNDEKYDILPKHIFIGFFVPIASGILLYWPFIPFHTATQFYSRALYAYHSQLWITFLYIIAFNFFFVYVAVFVNDSSKIQNILKVNLKSVKVPRRQVVFTNVLIGMSFFGIFGPYMLETGLLAYSGFDREKYSDQFIYDNRRAVRELYEAVGRLGYPNNEITVGLNLPGYEYYLNRPFLELQELDSLLVPDVDTESIFFSTDEQKVIQEFINNDIRLLVAMKPPHYFYNVFEQVYKSKYPFISFMENNGIVVYENTEFILYRVVV